MPGHLGDRGTSLVFTVYYKHFRCFSGLHWGGILFICRDVTLLNVYFHQFNKGIQSRHRQPSRAIKHFVVPKVPSGPSAVSLDGSALATTELVSVPRVVPFAERLRVGIAQCVCSLLDLTAFPDTIHSKYMHVMAHTLASFYECMDAPQFIYPLTS